MLTALLFLLSCHRKDADNIKWLNFLESDLYASSNDSRKAYFLDSISENLEHLPNDSKTREFTFKVSAQYYYLGKYEDSRNISYVSMALSSKSGDSSNLARALYYVGDTYETDKKDSAFYYYKQSENLYRKLKDSGRLAKVHYNKAHLLFYMGNFIESEIEVLKALQNLDDADNELLRYMCNSLLGSIHTEMDELGKALEHFKVAGNLLAKLADREEDVGQFYDYNAINTIDICNIYDKFGQFERSIRELNKIATPHLEVAYPKLYSDVIGNLAYSMMKNGEVVASEKYHIRSLEIAKRLHHEQGVLYRTLNYGEFQLLKGDTLRANLLFEKALPLSKTLGSGREILRTLNFLAISDSPKALYYKNEYVRIIDSISKSQRASKEKFSRIEYETGKIQSANLTLTKKNIIHVLFSVFLIIASLSILFLRHQVAKKKEKALILQKKMADDELLQLINEFHDKVAKVKEAEQNRISKELHDGVVNQIYGIRMILGALNKSDSEKDRVQRLRYIKDLHKVETEIRTLSHGLYGETETNSTDFEILLHSLVASFKDISDTIFTCHIAPHIPWENYPSLVKINIYRILQELFANASKYSNALSCTLNIINTPQGLLINIRDNGSGFAAERKQGGIGLKNIQQRAADIGATLLIESEINAGVYISLQVPFIRD